MKVGVFVFLLMFSFASQAALKFSFQNEDLLKMIETYSKATGQRFVVDPSVRGKASILGADKVTAEEAFNFLSTALATNGFAISVQGDTMVVKAARNIQRDYLETTTTLPSLKPERLVTYIYTPKHISAESIMKEVRILSSRDGESNVFRNQLLITDWTPNLHRIDQILKQLDQPASAPR